MLRAARLHPEGQDGANSASRGAAKLGRIIVARRLVFEDRRKAWVHDWAGTKAGMNDDMSRFRVMPPCGVGRSTQGDQKTQGQNKTHCICSVAAMLAPVM